MPAIVTAALANDLKPFMEAHRRLIAGWSCSMMLFRYFELRTLTRCQAGCSRLKSRNVARYMAIECDLARSSIRMRGERPPKERLRSGNAPIRSQHEVYAAPLLVNGSAQIVPFALDRDVSLVDAPGTTDRAGKATPAFLKFRNIPNHPSHDRRVRTDHTALS